MPKIYKLKKASPQQIRMLVTFQKKINLSRNQMAENDNKRNTNGLNVAIREGKLKLKSLENIIEGERKRLAPFFKERDVAKAYHLITRLLPMSAVKLEAILIDKEGGKKGVVAGRIRQHGLTLEQKQIICEHQANMINQAFDYVDFTPLN